MTGRSVNLVHMKSRTVETSEVRIRQIVDAALSVFTRKGVQQASINEIVAEAGVSKGLLYLYFKGKDALIEAVMSRLFAPDLKTAQHLLEKEAPATQRLQEYARAMAADAVRYRKLLPLFFEYYSMLGRNKNLRKITARYYRQQEHLFCGLVRQGIEAGEFAEDIDAETVALSLLALQEGFIMRWMMEPDTTDWPAQAEASTVLLLNSISNQQNIYA